jgi:FG-GAP repeat
MLCTICRDMVPVGRVLLVLLLGFVAAPVLAEATPDASRHMGCIIETDSCVPATATLKYAGKVMASPAGNTENVFGLSVRVAGDLMAVGAPWDSERGYRAGAVYLFKAAKNGNWQQLAKLTPRQPLAKAMFGSSLDLAAGRLVVGAPGERQDKMISAGAVYVFAPTAAGRWQQQARIVPDTILAGDFFGSSVALLPEMIVVGAHLEDGKGIDSGAAYIFEPAASNQWQQRQKLQPESLKAGTLFGSTLTTDGRHLAIGAYGYDGSSPGGGAVYVYQRGVGNSWTLMQMLQPDARKAFAEFGWTLALRAGQLLVGAPYEDEGPRQMGTAYVFRLDPTQSRWVPVTKLRPVAPRRQERFGASVAFVGTQALVGAPYGAAYLFGSPPGGETAGGKETWPQQARLVGTLPDGDNLFNRTITTDGTLIALGVPLQAGKARPNLGGVYLFRVTPSPVIQSQGTENISAD